MPSARNTGGNQAQGEFLLFLDADDVIKLQFIQKAIDAIVNHNECKFGYRFEYIDNPITNKFS